MAVAWECRYCFSFSQAFLILFGISAHLLVLIGLRVVTRPARLLVFNGSFLVLQPDCLLACCLPAIVHNASIKM